MTDINSVYENPLISRYASREMAQLWSDERRILLWRRLWIWLAEVEQELGLFITNEQLTELRASEQTLNLETAARYERELRHDVMAQVSAYGEQCPQARAIIHLGATSCYVTDNSDLMLMRDGLQMVEQRLINCISGLSRFAKQHAALPCLAFTHLQPAQPTTVGKRAALWAHELVLDLEEIRHRRQQLRARSAKGTTGTQASFLQLFKGDHSKVRELERRITSRMGFEASYPVTGQTYSRKVDCQIVDALTGIGTSLHKIATDIRILASRKELEEPFEKQQIGSSAMAYKRNPMRCERICGLTRFVMSLQSSPVMTAAVQWLERTLDDSSNRRLVIPQAFLAIDASLVLMQNVIEGMVVYPKTIEKNLREEIPFMATESILMAGVAAGGDRQELHERIRQHSQAAAQVVKLEGLPNDLLLRLASDSAFAKLDIDGLADPQSFIGRAEQQVYEFVEEVIEPLLQKKGGGSDLSSEVRV